MFAFQMRERYCEVVEIQCLSFEDLSVIFDYIYDQPVELNEGSVYKLTDAAEYPQMPGNLFTAQYLKCFAVYFWEIFRIFPHIVFGSFSYKWKSNQKKSYGSLTLVLKPCYEKVGTF